MELTYCIADLISDLNGLFLAKLRAGQKCALSALPRYYAFEITLYCSQRKPVPLLNEPPRQELLLARSSIPCRDC